MPSLLDPALLASGPDSVFSAYSEWLSGLQALWALSDWTRLIAVLISLAALLIGCEWLRSRFLLPGELTRKIIHMLSGTMTCFFPLIFQSSLPILLLALVMTSLFITARYFKLFQSLFDINRRSAGDIYFILSVWILFLLTPHNRLYYVIPLLTLTIADALAALLGKSYQKFTYAVEQSFKSLEGSMVFFLATFLCVHIPLLLFSDIGRLESLLIPLELALLVTCLESICLNGLDNLFIPLSVYYILSHPITDLSHIITRLILLGFIMIFVLIAGLRLRFLAFSSTLVIQLFLYSLYTIHDYDWLFPAALAILLFGTTYALMNEHLSSWLRRTHRPMPNNQKAYQVLPVFYITLVPAILALSQDVCLRLECPSNLFMKWDLYPVFIASISLALSMALFQLSARMLQLKRGGAMRAALLISAFSAICIGAPFLHTRPHAQLLFSAVLATSLMGCLLQVYLLNCPWWPKQFPWPWRIYTICSALSLLLVWPLVSYALSFSSF